MEDKELTKILASNIPSVTIGTTTITTIESKNKIGIVQQHDLKNFSKVISKYKKFKLSGTSKPEKMKKYLSLAESQKYKISSKSIKNAGFEGINKDVLNYYIIFEK